MVTAVGVVVVVASFAVAFVAVAGVIVAGGTFDLAAVVVVLAAVVLVVVQLVVRVVVQLVLVLVVGHSDYGYYARLGPWRQTIGLSCMA